MDACGFTGCAENRGRGGGNGTGAAVSIAVFDGSSDPNNDGSLGEKLNRRAMMDVSASTASARAGSRVETSALAISALASFLDAGAAVSA